jgi:glyoxylase-like metal-dependent hydrolase (beta-lactamase superfamily II)
MKRMTTNVIKVGSISIEQISRLETGCLAYLIIDRPSGDTVIVDPGRDIDSYKTTLRRECLRLRGIVETHTHADHLAGHSALHALTDAPIYLSRRTQAQYPHRRLQEGDAVLVGNHEIVVLETPGHTMDHMTLVIGDNIFTGDTLLVGTCGRTDLGGSPNALWESLQERILQLPDSTRVFPAHFGPHHGLPEKSISTLGEERITNEALTQPTREEFVKYMTEGWPAKPKGFETITQTNLRE